jgi:hypothetical protein
MINDIERSFFSQKSLNSDEIFYTPLLEDFDIEIQKYVVSRLLRVANGFYSILILVQLEGRTRGNQAYRELQGRELDKNQLGVDNPRSSHIGQQVDLDIFRLSKNTGE